MAPVCTVANNFFKITSFLVAWVATAKYDDKLNLPSVEGEEELATSES